MSVGGGWFSINNLVTHNSSKVEFGCDNCTLWSGRFLPDIFTFVLNINLLITEDTRRLKVTVLVLSNQSVLCCPSIK